MVWTVCIAGPGSPDHLPENQHKDEEEDPDNFEEEDVPHSAEGAQKTAHAAAEASGSAACGSPFYPTGRGPVHALDGYGMNNGPASRIARGGLGVAGQPLSGDPARHAHAYAQYPPDRLRFHTRL